MRCWEQGGVNCLGARGGLPGGGDAGPSDLGVTQGGLPGRGDAGPMGPRGDTGRAAWRRGSFSRPLMNE